MCENIQYSAIFGENKLECLQFILWGWIKGVKIQIFNLAPYSYEFVFGVLNRVWFFKKYVEKSIKTYDSNSKSYKGLWEEMNEEAFQISAQLYNQHIINEDILVKYYNRIFDTEKFEAYIKKEIIRYVFGLLEGLYTIRLSDLMHQEILLNKTPINEFVIRFQEEKFDVKFRVRWIPNIQSLASLCGYYLGLIAEFMRRGVTCNRPKKSYKLAKEATWGFYLKTLRDDILIDNIKFKPKDLLLLELNPGMGCYRARAFEESKEKGFDTVSVPNLKININKNILQILYFYLFVPLRWYFQLMIRRQLYLFHYIFLFHRRSLPIEILMNSYQIKCYISTKDSGDIATTIIFNKYGTKDVIFHWSDLTLWKAYNYAFNAHNIYFVWGDIHYDTHCDTYFVERKVNIGCIYKKEYGRALKEQANIIARIGMRKGRKVVTFFDTSFIFNAISNYTDSFYLEYLGVMEEFCRSYKDVNVLFKPKIGKKNIMKTLKGKVDSYKGIIDGCMSWDNFSYLDPLQWSAEEIIAVSDVCVTMGMMTPSIIALLCGRDGLYFDTSGDDNHPFARRYKNVIVFEDRNLLFKQIENILDGEFSCKDVISEEEIREYDTFSDDNALERLRDTLYELTV